MWRKKRVLVLIFFISVIMCKSDEKKENYYDLLQDTIILGDAIILEIKKDSVPNFEEVLPSEEFQKFEEEGLIVEKEEEIEKFEEWEKDIVEEKEIKINYCDEKEKLPCPEKYGCIENNGKKSCVFIAECTKNGSLSVYEIIENIPKYDGTYIKVEGIAKSMFPVCTEKACDSNNPCCNTCFSQISLKGEKSEIIITGKSFFVGCNGNNCDFLEKCTPFIIGLSYRVWGIFTHSKGSNQIIADDYCLIY